MKDQVLLTYMMASLVASVENKNGSSCIPCEQLQVPSLNDLCWRYEANTMEEVTQVLKLSEYNSDETYQTVIKVLAPFIVAMKPVTRALVESGDALLNVWMKTFGDVPPGKGDRLDRVMQTVCENWAHPATTVEALENAKNLTSVLNVVPPKGDQVMPTLAQYVNARGFFESNNKRFCKAGLSLC